MPGGFVMKKISSTKLSLIRKITAASVSALLVLTTISVPAGAESSSSIILAKDALNAVSGNSTNSSGTSAADASGTSAAGSNGTSATGASGTSAAGSNGTSAANTNGTSAGSNNGTSAANSEINIEALEFAKQEALSQGTGVPQNVTPSPAGEGAPTEQGTLSNAGEEGSLSSSKKEGSIFSSTELKSPEESASQGVAKENGHIVGIDPGHQSFEIDMSALEPNGPGSSEMKVLTTTGTVGDYTGIGEYSLNLDISLALRDKLEARGYTVIMTREDNQTAISNKERAELVAAKGAEIFVRIHANSESSHTQSGALTMAPSPQNPYVSQLFEESDRLSRCLINAYCEKTGFANLGVMYSDTMTGINWSTIPVTILEMGFMSNEHDDWLMADAEFRDVMVDGIVNGIDDYFGIDSSVYLGSTVSPSLDTMQADADMQALMNQLSSQLPQGNGIWAVYVGDLSTGSSAAIGNARMLAASLIKLYIMGAVYENYDALASAYGSASLDNLLYPMITVSDNDAANTLVNYLGGGDYSAGMAAVNNYCQRCGYTDTHMGRLLLASNEFDDNYTSVRDCGVFLTRIYQVSRGLSTDFMPGAEAMFRLLSAQTRTHKIPSQLPGVSIANKTGELNDVENDVAIIYNSRRDLIICFMTMQVSALGAAQASIGELSRNIYYYYNQ